MVEPKWDLDLKVGPLANVVGHGTPHSTKPEGMGSIWSRSSIQLPILEDCEESFQLFEALSHHPELLALILGAHGLHFGHKNRLRR